MALREGEHYVFCGKTTYLGLADATHGCLLGTRSLLLVLPLGLSPEGPPSEPVDVRLRALLGDPGQTVPDLERSMRRLADEVAGGGCFELDQQARIRVRCGWLSRGIYLSDRPKGPGWIGFPLKPKATAEAWRAFYQGAPNFVS